MSCNRNPGYLVYMGGLYYTQFSFRDYKCTMKYPHPMFFKPKNSDDSMVVMQPGCSPLPFSPLKWTHLALGFLFRCEAVWRASSMSRGSVAAKWFKNLGGMSIATVDGWNPANQLRLVVYPIIYRVSAPSQVVSRISAINSSLPEGTVFCIHSTRLGGMKGFVLWRCFFC